MAYNNGGHMCPLKARQQCPQQQSGAQEDSRTGNTSVRLPDFSKFGSTMEELSKLEFVEMQNVEDDLRDFQIKRRKLVFNLSLLKLTKSRKSIKKAVSKMGL